MNATRHPGAALSCKAAIRLAAVAASILCAAPGCRETPPAPLAHLTTGPRCIVFEEEGRLTRVLSQILDDPSVAVQMKQLGARWLWVTPEDRDETGGFPEWLEEYSDRALAAGLPYLFVTDELGNVAWSGKPPDNPATFLAILKDYGKTGKSGSARASSCRPANRPLNPTKKRPLEAAANKSGPFPTQPSTQ